MNNLLENGQEEAKVLVIRNCIDTLFGQGKTKKLLEDLINLYWDSRYQEKKKFLINMLVIIYVLMKKIKNQIMRKVSEE